MPRTAARKKTASAAKLDLYKLHKAEYVTPKKPVLIDAKPARYLTIEGSGEPGGDVFQVRIGALYAAAYTIKMASKQAGRDYTVCKLEADWWTPGAQPCAFDKVPKSRWCWKFLIRTPDFIGKSELSAAVKTLLAKGKDPEVGDVRLETVGEGPCVQMLHVGPYDQEQESLAAMRAFAEAGGLSPSGPHREIYLSDPRRVASEKLRTILRQPVR